MLNAGYSACRRAQAFGGTLSQGRITQKETLLFSHTLAPTATHGVITHWWVTGGGSIDKAIISYYLDGELTSSISFSPPMATGTGFDDQGAVPWGTEWFGKGAKQAAWFSHFRIPFQKSINVTFKAGPGQPDDTIYIIVRGAENLPINIGGRCGWDDG